MPRNGAGTFTVLNPIVIGQLRSSSAVNEDYEDAGDELTNSLPVDGSVAMLGQFGGGEGDSTTPEISFHEDQNSGFTNSAPDTIDWIAGATMRARWDANGKLTLGNGLEVTGSVNLSGMFAPQNLVGTGQVPITLRREENDTSEHQLVSYESGSGAGTNASLRVVGSASNNVSAMRFYVNSAKAMEWSANLFTLAGNLVVATAGPLVAAAGYIDFKELSAAPSAPATNVARLYARDVGGVTTPFIKDAANQETSLSVLTDRQVITTSGIWTKPDRGAVALIEVWAGGASGGKSTAAATSPGGGGGGGAYTRVVKALASLSAAVSVTIGAGGAAIGTDNTTGAAGGQTSFGAYATAFGGGGGAGSSPLGMAGGGGGGPSAVGSAGNSTTGGLGGRARGNLGSGVWGTGGVFLGDSANSNPFGGGGGGGTSGSAEGEDAVYGGGGGGTDPDIGGTSIFGGAGGSGGGEATAAVSLYGGNGGAANTDGSAPGGGGGGAGAGNSGAGARGEVRITVW